MRYWKISTTKNSKIWNNSADALSEISNCIFIFIFCNRNENFYYFLQWQCNLFKFLCIGNTNFLILAFAIQMFCIFCIGNTNFFHFWDGNANFLNLCIGNAYFYFLHRFDEFFSPNWHWQCKFFIFFALASQIFKIFVLAMQIF